MTETDIQNQIRLALSKHGIVIRLQSGNYELKDGRRIVCGVKLALLTAWRRRLK